MGMEKGLNLTVAGNASEYGGIDAMVFVYSFVAYAFAIAPLVIYLVVDNDALGYKRMHQKMITSYTTAYGPLVFTLPYLLISGDSEKCRMMLMGAVMFAGMGPYALFWAGYFDFLQKGSDKKVLKESDNTLFIILYGVGNLLLLLVHYIMAPMIYNWATTAALPPVVVEEPTPEEEGEEGEEGAEEEE